MGKDAICWIIFSNKYTSSETIFLLKIDAIIKNLFALVRFKFERMRWNQAFISSACKCLKTRPEKLFCSNE